MVWGGGTDSGGESNGARERAETYPYFVFVLGVGCVFELLTYTNFIVAFYSEYLFTLHITHTLYFFVSCLVFGVSSILLALSLSFLSPLLSSLTPIYILVLVSFS
ncbi:hypothetical protein EDC01DRAFT_349810 [Geopyxis carbonaria]|nr:hypothetical protein EDC01DRAFT_349810 [Geopyxis carbonaria]